MVVRVSIRVCPAIMIRLIIDYSCYNRISVFLQFLRSLVFFFFFWFSQLITGKRKRTLRFAVFGGLGTKGAGCPFGSKGIT